MRRLQDLGFEYLGVLRPRASPTAGQISAIEERVGAELPEDYKAFLASQNGGSPRQNFVQVGADEDEGYRIECFNYVDGAEEDGYDVQRASRRPSRALGEQVVAIAPDGSGDQLLLRPAEEEWRVEWWHHDRGPSTTLVAESFFLLLDRLRLPTED